MNAFFELIRGLGTPFNMVALISLIFAVMGVGVAIAGMIGVISKEIREFACHREDLQFKRELLDRGVTIDEIGRLIRSRNTQKE